MERSFWLVTVPIVVIVVSFLWFDGGQLRQTNENSPAGSPSKSHLTPETKSITRKRVSAGSTVQTDAQRPVLGLVWFAPFFSQSGYGTEARDFALALSEHVRVQIVQHGDSVSRPVVDGLKPMHRDRLIKLLRSPLDNARSIIVCHSEPGAWHPPRWPTAECPPQDQKAAFTVGRTMFETDRLPDGWAKRLNNMDEVWVPSKWAVNVFAAGGVDRDKLVQVPEAVDVSVFDPTKVTAMKLPRRKKFAFLSIFKWEERKGWDVLLEAFFREFSPDDDVSLHLLTHGYHDDSEKSKKPLELARALKLDLKRLPSHSVIDVHVSDADLIALYAASDAFVLPSRGEGWGRPHVEAMAMELPILATNWSGSTEFMTEENSYPIKVEGLVPVKSGAFQGHRWAQPSVTHLRQLMRHVVDHPDEAATKGKRARLHMHRNYSPEVLAQTVMKHMRRIHGRIKHKLAL